MALKGEVGVIPRISYLWYLSLKTYIWNRTYTIMLIRLRAEWECMQMESMISSIRWPFYVKLVSPSATATSMTPLFTGPCQTAIASKECVPQEWGGFENVLFSQALWCRCICWLGVAMTSWLIPRRWSKFAILLTFKFVYILVPFSTG